MSDPLTLGTAVTAASSGASLLNNLFTLVKTAREKGQDPALTDVLAAACPEALSLAGRFVQEVQQLRQKLLKAEIDLKKTDRELIAETSWWRRKRYRLVHGFQANIDAIRSQLSGFLDDIVAVAHCCGADEFIANSFSEAAEMRKVLYRETNPDIPVGAILDMLEGRAQDIRTALGDICG